jgi:hypothetical protein
MEYSILQDGLLQSPHIDKDRDRLWNIYQEMARKCGREYTEAYLKQAKNVLNMVGD